MEANDQVVANPTGAPQSATVADDLNKFVVPQTPEQPDNGQAQVQVAQPTEAWGTFTDPKEAAKAYVNILPDYTRKSQEASRLEAENRLLREQLNRPQTQQAPTVAPDPYQDPQGYQRFVWEQARQSARQEVSDLLQQAGTIQAQQAAVVNQVEFSQKHPAVDAGLVKNYMQTIGMNESAPHAYENAYYLMTRVQQTNQTVQSTLQQAKPTQTPVGAIPVRGGGSGAQVQFDFTAMVNEYNGRGLGAEDWLRSLDQKTPGLYNAFHAKAREVRERK